MPVLGGDYGRRKEVSIHAPRHRGAMRRMEPSSFAFRPFQSTPPVTEGRCPCDIRLAIQHRSFNPRPPSPRGDAYHRFVDVAHANAVSIHAPRHRGAMLVLDRGSPCFPDSFNPRPPSPRGDADGFVRHVRRDQLFQSTPPVTEGRCSSHRAPQSCHERFNPRPPSPRGDARPRWARALSRWSFQSTPPVTEGRCSASASPKSRCRRFQSTPPVTEGRCSSLIQRIVASAQFQSTPPSPRGDASITCGHAVATKCFNPRPPSPRGDAAESSPRARPSRSFNPRPPSPRGDATPLAGLGAGR